MRPTAKLLLLATFAGLLHACGESPTPPPDPDPEATPEATPESAQPPAPPVSASPQDADPQPPATDGHDHPSSARVPADLPPRFTDHVPQYRQELQPNGEDTLVETDPVPFDMVLIPGDPEQGLAPFYLGETEVTWAMMYQWMYGYDLIGREEHARQEFEGLRPSYLSDYGWDVMALGRNCDTRPANGLSWRTAETFCVWLSEKTGRTYRLPTEAEWRHAARLGGHVPDGREARVGVGTFYENSVTDDDLNDPFYEPDDPWYHFTTAVASHPPNALGIYDMHGNVAEWVSGTRDGRRFVVGGHFHLEAEAYHDAWYEAEDQDVWNATYPQKPPSESWYLTHYYQGFRLVCEVSAVPDEQAAPAPEPRSADDLPPRFNDYVPQFERGRRIDNTNTFEVLTKEPVPFGMVLVPGDPASGIAPFYLGETEVTWAMFKGWALHTDLADMSDAYDLQQQGLRPSHYGEFAFAEFDTPQRPAVGLNRHTAELFCAWLSEQTGRRYRLPTNAEWELAARLGGGFPEDADARLARGTFLENSDRDENDPFYDPEGITEDLYSSRYHCYPSHVANHPPDALGLYDMHGNAAEWVSDLDDGRPYVRGGHFHLPVEAYDPGWRGVEDQRVWNEFYPSLPYSKYWYMNHYYQGFRLVCEPDNLPADVGEPLILPRTFRGRVPYRDLTDEADRRQHDGFRPDPSGIERDLTARQPSFDMALIPGDEANGIAPFYMQTTEVTWDMFGNWFAGRGLGDAAFERWRGYGFHPSMYWDSDMVRMGLGDRPAVGMSRRAAELFCAWLSGETGRAYRLPTDAEWRHALAAGGGVPATRDGLLKQAALHDNGRFKSGGIDVLRVTFPVGELEPNALGLHDLLGNAAEWVTGTGDERAVRGGHYLLPAAELSADWRAEEDLSVWNASYPQHHPDDPGVRRDAPFVGFRLVCDVPD